MNKITTALSAILSVMVLSNCAAGSSPSNSASSPHVTAQHGVRTVQAFEIKNLRYSLKADLDFSAGEKIVVPIFKGLRDTEKAPAFIYSIVHQRVVPAAEAAQAAAACTLSAWAQGNKAPKFTRTASLAVADFGVLTSSEASTFEIRLKVGEEVGHSFKIRCRNVVDRSELETQIGHLFRLDR